MATVWDVNTKTATDFLTGQNSNELSHATVRKLRIIEQKFGNDWKEQHNGKSIDAVYNVIIGDTRKNLFCKLDPEVKKCMDEMVDYHDIKMAELVEKLIEEEYDRFVIMRDAKVAEMASQFAIS
jgi:hypothetical protein